MEEYRNCSVRNVTSIAERADSAVLKHPEVGRGLEEAVRFGPAEHKMASLSDPLSDTRAPYSTQHHQTQHHARNSGAQPRTVILRRVLRNEQNTKTQKKKKTSLSR